MTRTTLLIIPIAAIIVCAVSPTHAAGLSRAFVSGAGNDANACSFTAPCRTFQHAHDVLADGGEIDVLDPAGYGQLNITRSISIQAHGFGGISVTSGNAISINAPETARINLNGLLLDGLGTGGFGIGLTTAGFVTITGTQARRFAHGIGLLPLNRSNRAVISVSNTIVADNSENGILFQPTGNTQLIIATFNRVEAYGNGQDGFFLNAESTGSTALTTMIDCVAAGNGFGGAAGGSGFHSHIGTNSLAVNGFSATFYRSVATNNNTEDLTGEDAIIVMARSNFDFVSASKYLTYGDNDIDGRPLPSALPPLPRD